MFLGINCSQQSLWRIVRPTPDYWGVARRPWIRWTLGLLKGYANPSASRGAVLGGLGSNPLQDFTAQWELLWETVAVILVSSTEVPAKFTALFTSLGCRQSYAFYRANIHTLLVVTLNVFSTSEVLCSLQCTWLFMRGDLWLFSIAHELRHTHTSVYNYASSKSCSLLARFM